MLKKWILLTILASGLSAVAAGCGSDDGPSGGNNIVGSNNGTGNNGANDSGHSDASDATDTTDAVDDGGQDASSDTDATGDAQGDTDGSSDVGSCPEVPCAEGMTCVDGVCEEITSATKCQAPTVLGTLSPDNPLTITDTTAGATDVLETSCSDGGAEMVYEFTVAEDSRVSFASTWSGQMDAKIEFRESCETQAPDEACFDADSSLFIPANTTAYLVIEQDVGQGNDFTVELTATAESCPLGERTCSADELEICTGGNQGQTYACAASCATDSACSGDTCADAIEVTADTTFSGDLRAYNSSINFDGETLCALSNGDTVPTPGRELVFELPNLTAGQTVNIDAGTNDSNLNGIFVLNGCSATPYQCVEVAVEETTSFVAPSDGTYYVVIDKLTSGGNAFEYSINFQ